MAFILHYVHVFHASLSVETNEPTKVFKLGSKRQVNMRQLRGMLRVMTNLRQALFITVQVDLPFIFKVVGYMYIGLRKKERIPAIRKSSLISV